MDKDKLKGLANDAIDNYFDSIDSVIDDIVSKIAEEHGIEGEDDIKYLKTKITNGILKLC